jgi:hypothetical protein
VTTLMRRVIAVQDEQARRRLERAVRAMAVERGFAGMETSEAVAVVEGHRVLIKRLDAAGLTEREIVARIADDIGVTADELERACADVLARNEKEGTCPA